MGCVQAKLSLTSPDRHVIEKFKVHHGYVVVGGGGGGGRASNARRATEMEEERNPPTPSIERRKMEDDVVDGWPRWLVKNVPKGVLDELEPKSAESYELIGKVGQGTYSNVYKARDKETGKLVALKKVRFDTSESESVRFMAREILIMQKLDHPNVLKLEGLATSRMHYSLYLVFEYMQTDLARVISRPGGRLTEPQVKCYMHQLLSGLQHCHERGILHRDIKGSNLLLDKNGILKIGDFGLAKFYNLDKERPLTSRVVTLWYRAPELLLGSTDYGVGIDLWSAGCLLAEMFSGRPIMPGRTEVEQLNRIFKLCGSPSEDYWRRLKLSTNFRPQFYKSSISESFRDFPASLGLLTTLLALDPSYRGTAASALQNEFFSTSPLACDLSGLPVIYQQENDVSKKLHERRKNKTSKLRPRSQSQKEKMAEFEHDVDISKVDYYSSKRGERYEDVTTHKQATGGSSSTTSTTSSANADGFYVAVSPQSPSLTAEHHHSDVRNIVHQPSSLSKQLPRTEYYPALANNIMSLVPPQARSKIPAADNNEVLDVVEGRFGMEKRSVSMSYVGKVAGEQISNDHALGD